MTIIYTPRGPALEYAPLAVNLYRGCTHRCGYCYAPGVTRTKWDTFRSDNRPRADILDRLEKDCKKMAGEPREILLCFTSDPYQEWIDSLNDITRQALKILALYDMNVTVLTKGGTRAQRDFDILKEQGWSFGTTLSWINEEPNKRKQWEPDAAGIQDRIQAIRLAHVLGIRTWVSVEPVIYCDEALKAIEAVSPWTDHFKIGKISRHPYIEKRENWPLFLEQVEALLAGTDFYVKNDLWKAAGREIP